MARVFNSIKAWVTNRPAVSFYMLTLALSWGYWLTLLAMGLRVEPGSGLSHFPGLLGPMFAAIFLTAVIGRWQAMLELFRRIFWLGPHWAAQLTLALLPLALGTVAFVVIALLGKPIPKLNAFAHFPGLPEDWSLIAVVGAVIVVNGFGEETGWRGFLTERLLPKYGRVRSTLCVALLWALWHLPLFWLITSMNSLVGPILIGWLFALFCGAFVLAQVYFLTGHSILCVALWHTAYNMMVATEIGMGIPAAIVGTSVMVWGAIVAVMWWRAVREPARPDLLLNPTKPYEGMGHPTS